MGDEIAELAAHQDAAGARVLELIREFDAREGWGTGFSSCAAWLCRRVGLDPGAAGERDRVVVHVDARRSRTPSSPDNRFSKAAPAFPLKRRAVSRAAPAG